MMFTWYCPHLGTEKTVEMVKRQFYWPGMDADIYAYRFLPSVPR
jgi:hypothetical protein